MSTQKNYRRFEYDLPGKFVPLAAIPVVSIDE